MHLDGRLLVPLEEEEVMEALLSRQQDSQRSFPLTPRPGGTLENLAGNPVCGTCISMRKKK